MTSSRKVLMIPGPTEFDSDVLRALGQPSESHVSPTFIEHFGTTLENIRKVFLTKSGQPFVLSGGGTLGWDAIVASLTERGDRALVLNSGYFSDSFRDCLQAYDVTVRNIQAPSIGDVVPLNIVEQELQRNPNLYKLIAITQVDTSTAVLNDVAGISRLVKKYSPQTLVAVDGVCSFAGEEFRFDDWGVDAAMTASQKALGVPPGLAVVVLSQRAVRVMETRRTPVPSYYANLQNWLPIMKAYEARKPSYFSTPNVNLITALRVATDQLLGEGMESVFARHTAASDAFKNGIKALGLSLLPARDEVCAHLLTAVKYPPGVDGKALLTAVKEAGVVFAGGLHREVKGTYFRVGHMGVSASFEREDLLKSMQALEYALAKVGFQFPRGAGVAALNRGLRSKL